MHGALDQAYLAFGFVFVQHLGNRIHGACILEYGRQVAGGYHLYITGLAVGQNLVDSFLRITAHILHLRTAVSNVFSLVINFDDMESIALSQLLLSIEVARNGVAAASHYVKVQRVELLEES